MQLPVNVALLLFTCIPLAAQEAQDPAKELAELTQEKQRLLLEIDYVKDRVTNAKGLLAGKLGKRTTAFRTIDAGKTTIAQPQAPTPPVVPRPARMMLDDERSNHPGNVMLLVNGNPITQESFDELMAYQNTRSGTGPDDESVRAMIALADLVRIETMATAFRESEADGQLAEAMGELEGGKAFLDVIKARGTLRGAAEDGRIQVTHRSLYGPKLEQMAFSVKPGSRSRPFRHHTGLVVLHVDSIEKGATPELEKASVQALNIPYTTEPDTLAKAEQMLSTGQVEIIVRDSKVMAMLPPGFRDQDEVIKAAQTVDFAGMEKSLAQVEAEMERLSKSTSEADMAMLADLKLRHATLKVRIEKLREKDGGGTTPAPKKD